MHLIPITIHLKKHAYERLYPPFSQQVYITANTLNKPYSIDSVSQKPRAMQSFAKSLTRIAHSRPKETQECIWRMEEILRNADVEERAMTWLALGEEAGLNGVSERTIQRAMGRLDYHKCVACQRGWVSKDLAERRVE